MVPPSRCRVQILVTATLKIKKKKKILSGLLPRSFRPECRILLVESCLMTLVLRDILAECRSIENKISLIIYDYIYICRIFIDRLDDMI